MSLTWSRHPNRRRLLLIGGCLLFVAAACGGAREATPDAGTAIPVYDPDTGLLQELRSDRDGDGTVDTVARMDGTRIVHIEIDSDNDGQVDRREYYGPSDDRPEGIIERAEEFVGGTSRIRRWEFYEEGVLVRVEEDTTLDGQVDKWETYEGGRLAMVELDLTGGGRPTRRLVYGADGSVVRVEADPDGDGHFEPVVPSGDTQ